MNTQPSDLNPVKSTTDESTITSKGCDARDGVYLNYRIIREGESVRVEFDARDCKPGCNPASGSGTIELG